MKNKNTSKSVFKKIRKIPRSRILTQNMVGRVFKVHNGKNFSLIAVTNLKLGTKAGEYVLTRKPCVHKTKKKKKK